MKARLTQPERDDIVALIQQDERDGVEVSTRVRDRHLLLRELDAVTKERDEARDAAVAFRELNAAFRVGRPPSQKLCERLAVAGDAVRIWPKPERKP